MRSATAALEARQKGRVSDAAKVAMLEALVKEKNEEIARNEETIEQKDEQLAQKDKIIAQKEVIIIREDGKPDRPLPDGALPSGLVYGDPDMTSRIKMLDETMRRESQMISVTGLDIEEFEFILDLFTEEVLAHGDMPLFREDTSRGSDPGNRCKLHIRHALLMILMYHRLAAPQELLAMIFGIEQSNVSRQLERLKPRLRAVLPTAWAITIFISLCESLELLKELLPGRNGGEVLLDGTRTPRQRPKDEKKTPGTYSGKIKRHSYNTLVGVNRDGIISCISPTEPGGVNDVKMTEHIGQWITRMTNVNILWKNRIKCLTDLGFLGIKNYLPGIISVQPAKRKPGKSLSKTDRERNENISRRRVPVEHAIGHMKNYRILTRPYGGTAEELNADMDTVTGLVNLHRLFGPIKDGTGVYGLLMRQIRAGQIRPGG